MMSIKSFISNHLKNKLLQKDRIIVEVDSLDIKMIRCTNPEISYEVTVVVPRAEIRKKYNESGHLLDEEIILSSITVVHAPRHPLAGPPTPPPEIPSRFFQQTFKNKTTF